MATVKRRDVPRSDSRRITIVTMHEICRQSSPGCYELRRFVLLIRRHNGASAVVSYTFLILVVHRGTKAKRCEPILIARNSLRSTATKLNPPSGILCQTPKSFLGIILANLNGLRWVT